MPYLTINEVGVSAIKPDGDKSLTGHMWYQLTDDYGAMHSFGFGPKGEAVPWGPGEVNRVDSSYYIDRSYTRTVWISQSRYNAMMAFGEATTNAAPDGWVRVKGVDGNDHVFQMYYNGVFNSCVDYTWMAMEVGGLNPGSGINPGGYQGELFPQFNSAHVNDALNRYEYLLDVGVDAASDSIHVCSDTTYWDPDFGWYDAPEVVVISQTEHLINLSNAEYSLWHAYYIGSLGYDKYIDFTRQNSDRVLNYSITEANTTDYLLDSFNLVPIGAFYDSQRMAYENAYSIATKTGVLVDLSGHKLTLTLLAELDTNNDNVLSVSEAFGLRMLTDLNENGHLDSGELNMVSSAIFSVDWSRFIRGNALMAGYELEAPTVSAMAQSTTVNLIQPFAITLTQPEQMTLVQAVPASNYRTLREIDNRYWINSYSWIDWSAGQIKINSGAKNTLIGTDGNDIFDASYYKAYTQFFPTVLCNFLAGDGDDMVGGSGGNDNIWGGMGNDMLYGYAGQDKLYGEVGNDMLLGQDGNDSMDGGIGDDRLFGYVGNDILIGDNGNDMLMGFTPSNDAKQTLNAGETDDDYLYGGAGVDSLHGGLGNDYLDGGTENDFLSGGSGDDKLFGGDGSDELQGNEGHDQLVGGTGDDKFFGQVGNDVLYGADGNDILMGFTALNEAKQTLNAGETDDDYLYGGAGVDSLYGGLGNDYLDGGTENDLLSGGSGDDKLFGGDGSDELQGNEGHDQLVGGTGDDKFFGQVGNDVLYGGDGNDILIGFTASNEVKQTLIAGEMDDDYLYGGRGYDSLYGGFSNDYLDGGTENDFLSGGSGDDKLFGGDGLDELQGNEGNDQLIGGTGDDKLFGQVGNDILFGGDGNDILDGFTTSNEVKQMLDAGETDDDILYGEGGNDNLYGFAGNDLLDGSTGNDILLGGIGDDNLYGGDGLDELQGNEGNDQLVGEIGDDKLFGQVGNDALWGGNGNDLLMGFTASNESKQMLDAGETDNDNLYGGAGSDILIGGLGNDTLYGGDDRDELQGNEGNDLLYGDCDNDNLFGEEGNDVLYGGDGDDLLIGFMASNESRQMLNAGETDNDNLYGGAGNDSLIGDVGDDHLDGGAGSDTMAGGMGNDTYIVNSVNDSIYEQAGEGYDTVITTTNYLLNANIEELLLLEGGTINGTGNMLDNLIVGNSSDNILDGVTGADTMVGGAGNDIYYVDNDSDVVTELAGAGITDTVQSSISCTLASNVENLVLLDFAKPESGLVGGVRVLIYGYPKRNELDYMQGDAVENYQGTCALTSIANLITQTGKPARESQVVSLAIQNNWAVNTPSLPSYQLGGSTVEQQRAILDSYGIANNVITGFNETGIANLVRSGRGVILALNAGVLWGDSTYSGTGGVNHAVTLTGVVYSESDGTLMGFYLADSGRGKVSDMTRFVDIDIFRNAANVASAYAIYTVVPIKFWQEDFDGIGNELANTLVGNRGNNVLVGLAGNDTLQGAAGDDILVGGVGDDTLYGGGGDDVYRFSRGAGCDVLHEDDVMAGGNDVLEFVDDVAYNQLWLSHVGNDLVISIIGGADNVTIQNWYSAASNHIEQIRSADGKVLRDADVDALVQAMATMTAPTAGQSVFSEPEKAKLAPVLAANWC